MNPISLPPMLRSRRLDQILADRDRGFCARPSPDQLRRALGRALALLTPAQVRRIERECEGDVLSVGKRQYTWGDYNGQLALYRLSKAIDADSPNGRISRAL